MKQIYLSFLTLFAVTAIQAQWDLNPTNPTPVCNEPGNQNAPQSYPDGEGGLYVFWLDARVSSSSKDIYGQHYNAQGQALWEEQGREILNIEKDIPFFSFYRYSDGRFFMAWYENEGAVQTSDGVFVQELDEEGQFIWPETLKLSEENAQGALSVGVFLSFQMIRKGDNCLALINVSTYGYQRMRVVTFNISGELTSNFNGTEIGPLDFGWSAITPDHSNGVYVYYSTANGAGAPLMVNRLSMSGIMMWPQWKAVTEGAPGLAYQFAAIGLDDGLMAVWVANFGDIIAQRMDTLGNLMFSPYLNICTAPGTQDGFQLRRKDNELTIVWHDGRPGVLGTMAVYGQRFTPDGEMMWEENGIEIANQGSGNPLAVFNYTDDESIVVFYQTTTDGFKERVQKIYPDGTRGYGQDGLIVVDGMIYSTSDKQKSVLMTGTNILTVWRAFGPSPQFENVYIARVEDLINYVDESVSACNNYEFMDEVLTESGIYTYELPGDTILTLDLTIVPFSPEIMATDSGLVSSIEGLSYSWIDCNTGEFLSADSLFVPSVSGLYGLQVDNGVCNYSTACLYVPVYIYVDSTLAVCNELNLDGMVISESGIYNLFMPGDTIIVLNLTVETLTATVLQNGNALSFQPAEAELLQWVDCDTGAFLSQDSVFEIEETGNYACVISLGACTTASECLEYIYTGVDEMTSPGILLYPNPGGNALFIRIENQFEPLQIRIIDTQGRIVLSEQAVASVIALDTAPLAEGLYVVEVLSETIHFQTKWIKSSH